MSTAMASIKFEESALTESDLALTFHKDETLPPNDQSLKQEDDQRSTLRGHPRHSRQSFAQQTLSDVSSFMNSWALETFQVADESVSQDRTKVSNIREYSEYPVAPFFGVNSKFEFREELGQDSEKGEEKESEEGSREMDPPLNIRDEEEVKTKIRDLGNKIRKYTVERNRLKYLLRKDSQVEEESLETRECPCCGKYISKLCFKCEHLYCNPQNCPRKKKQKLNARMLERMREKKKEEDDDDKGLPRLRRRPRRHLNQAKGQFESSDEEEEFDQISLETEEPEDEARTRMKVPLPLSKKSAPAPTWKMTMSEISFGESKLYISQEELPQA